MSWFVLTHCLIIYFLDSFIDRKSGRIRAVSWYLIMTYQSHNNERPPNSTPGGPGATIHINTYTSYRYHTPRILINNFCYGKSQVRITRDFLCVDLRKKLNSLTSRFRQVVDMYNNVWWWIADYLFDKTEGLFLSNSQFLMKRTPLL